MTEHDEAIPPDPVQSPKRKGRDTKSSAVVIAADEMEGDIQTNQLAAGKGTAGASNDPLVAIVEGSVTPEIEILEELGKEGLKAADTAVLSLAERFRELASESTSCTKELLDSSYAFAGELRQAKSPAAAVEVQIDFARLAFVRLLDHFLKMSGLYWDLLRQACELTETEPAKVKC
jgi:hypothetical protein